MLLFGVAQFLKALVPLVRKLGPRANPGVLREVPLKAYAVWALYAGMLLNPDTAFAHMMVFVQSTE